MGSAGGVLAKLKKFTTPRSETTAQTLTHKKPAAAPLTAPPQRRRTSLQPSELGLSELVNLALANDMELQQLIAAESTAVLDREALRDWEDPELRMSIGRDYDVELDSPYTERRVSYTDTHGRDVTRSVKRESQGNSSRERQIQKTRELERVESIRKVIPGIQSNRIVETTRSRSLTTGHDTRHLSQELGGFRSVSGSRESESRESLERSKSVSEYFNAFDPTYPDLGWEMKIRFRIPHPWERKALWKQATGEIQKAQAEISARRREIIQDVRNAYEEAAFSKAVMKVDQLLLDLAVDYQMEQNLLLKDGFIQTDDLVDTQLDELKTQARLNESQRELEKAKFELAVLVGIDSTEKIRITDTLVSRSIDLDNMNLEFLVGIAALYRPDLGELKANLSVTEGALDEARARRIPFLTFVDFEYGQEFRQADLSNDSFGVQLGVSLPLFSIWKNRSAAARQHELETVRSRLAYAHQRISSQVALAVHGIRRAAELMQIHEKLISRSSSHTQLSRQSLEESGMTADQIAEAEYEAKEMHLKNLRESISVRRDYNVAVMELESAIGTEIGHAFLMNKGKNIATPVDAPQSQHGELQAQPDG